MNIGIIGLGSMGSNLAKNIISKKYKVYAYEENPEVNNDLKKNKVKDLFLTESLNELLNKVISPRICLLYTSPSPRDISGSRMPSSA